MNVRIACRVAASLVTVTIAWAPLSAGRQPAASDLQQKTAAYVHAFIAGISNVVAEEAMQFKSGTNVKSEFLLVQHPGSSIDFLAFRDVESVNGTPLPNREAHLTELFQKNLDTFIERARKISTDGATHMPVVLNPLFAISFLQSEYQARFRLEEGDASGREWPKGTRTLSFVETAKPTLLRSGQGGVSDVPTRGKAWIEASTGKVLQTELQVREGRKVTKLTTRFDRDARLDVMVPTEMRTEAPDGVATYSNFRRFNVTTDEALEPNAPK